MSDQTSQRGFMMSGDDVWGDHAIRATDLKAHPQDITYAGVTSYLRRPYRKDLKGVDAVVYGVPFDTATTNRPGTRFGPRGIRAASTGLAFEKLPYGLDYHPIDEMAIADHGDMPLDFAKPDAVPDAITKCAKDVLDEDTMMVAMGGDHFITYPLIKAHAEKHGAPLSIIHFDAHTDTWADEHEDGINHGTMFWHATREGLIDPATSVQIGIRTCNLDTMGFNILDAPWVHQNGIEKTISEARRIVGDKKCYLTFDIDCLDPSYAPGTGTPVVGGLTTNQANQIVMGMKGVNIVGADLVEVAPVYDVGEITALAGATLILHFLALFARAPWRTA